MWFALKVKCQCPASVPTRFQGHGPARGEPLAYQCRTRSRAARPGHCSPCFPVRPGMQHKKCLFRFLSNPRFDPVAAQLARMPPIMIDVRPRPSTACLPPSSSGSASPGFLQEREVPDASAVTLPIRLMGAAAGPVRPEHCAWCNNPDLRWLRLMVRFWNLCRPGTPDVSTSMDPLPLSMDPPGFRNDAGPRVEQA